MASLVSVVLYLCLHACAARPLLFRDEGTVTQLELSSKDVRNSIAERLIITEGEFKSTVDLGTNMVQLKDQRSFAVKEEDNVKGNFQNRAERSTLESPEETVNSKNNNTVEDIVVMDYAQPHRKPPIHNRGT